MIEYNGVIEMLKTKLPEFIIEEEISDSPTIVISFLTIFIKEKYKEKDDLRINKCANIVNDLAENDDSMITALLDEIAIGLFDESREIYTDFKTRLSDKARIKLERTIEYWSRQF